MNGGRPCVYKAQGTTGLVPTETTMFTIQSNLFARTSGTYLLDGNPDPRLGAICSTLFPNDFLWGDEDNGYGKEWVFKADSGQTFTVYMRWDEPRIGGRAGGQYSALDFQTWLLEQGMDVTICWVIP